MAVFPKHPPTDGRSKDSGTGPCRAGESAMPVGVYATCGCIPVHAFLVRSSFARRPREMRPGLSLPAGCNGVHYTTMDSHPIIFFSRIH